jgi:hypothetical protein
VRAVSTWNGPMANDPGVTTAKSNTSVRVAPSPS